MPENLIAVRPGCYGKFHKDAFAHLPTIGIRHVEIHPPAPAEWSALKAELATHKIIVSSVGGGVDCSKPESIEAFAILAKAAQEFGAKIIFLSIKTGGRDVKECYGILRQFGDAARSFGATIALETHPDLVTNGDIAAQTMAGVAHPNVKLNYDSANLYYYNDMKNGGADGIVELKKFMPYLGAVHLKESNGKMKTWYFPGLHEGDAIVDFPEIFRLCNSIGFHGPFTMEIEGIEGESLTREQSFARMENSVKYLRSIGVMK